MEFRMRPIALLLLLVALAGCSHGAPTYPGPPKDAPIWDLNPGKWQGRTNKLIAEPTQEASHGQMAY
jgi:predicted small lipoprotein YifL